MSYIRGPIIVGKVAGVGAIAVSRLVHNGQLLGCAVEKNEGPVGIVTQHDLPIWRVVYRNQ